MRHCRSRAGAGLRRQLGERFSVPIGPGESVWLTTGRGDQLESVLYKAADKAAGDELWSVAGRAEGDSPRHIHVALVRMRVSLDIDRGRPAWLDVDQAAELARASGRRWLGLASLPGRTVMFAHYWTGHAPFK